MKDEFIEIIPQMKSEDLFAIVGEILEELRRRAEIG